MVKQKDTGFGDKLNEICEKAALYDKIKAADPIVEAVRTDLIERSNVGIAKYGFTLADNKCSLRAKLQHAYEECLDQANYLKWAILQLGDENAS